MANENDVKRAEGAAEETTGEIKQYAGEVVDDEELDQEGRAEKTEGRIKKGAAEVSEKAKEAAGRAKEKLEEAAGAAKKAVHSFIHDDKKMAKNQPYMEKGTADPKPEK